MKRSARYVLFIGLGLAALALAAWASLPGAIEVDAALATRGDLLETVDHEGKTRVKNRYEISAPLAGRLLRITLKPGDPVQAGRTTLATIEPTDPALLDARALAQAQARVDAAEAARQQAVSNLERAKALHDQARRDLHRLQLLARRRNETDEEYEAALAKEQAAAADVRAAEAGVQIARFELEQARAALLFTKPPSPGDAPLPRFEIESPITGVVLRVFQESSTVVTPGARLLEIGDPSDLECEIDVLSTDAVRVRPGQRVIIEHWGGDYPLRGRVRVREPAAFTKISALGIEEQRVNIIIDLVDPPEQHPTLGDGYRVEARIVTWEGRDVLRIPSGALFRQGGDWAVFRVEQGRAVVRPVKVGHNDDNQTQILGGLAPGDLVVLYPSDRIKNGVQVAPRTDAHARVTPVRQAR